MSIKVFERCHITFTLSLKFGILFWCYFVFFFPSFSLMYVLNRMCICVAFALCELGLNFRNVTL